MGLLSQALLTELRTVAPRVFIGLSLALPGGTRLYSDAAVGTTAGQYDPKVLEWGSLSRAVSDRNYNLESLETDVTIADYDRSFSTLLESASGDAVLDSTAIITLGSNYVDPAGWFSLFSGRLYSFTQTAEFTWRLSLRPLDRPLHRDVPRIAIALADWPNSDSSARGQYAPLLYGKHNSNSGRGFVPTYYVDTAGFRYMVCAGWAKAVDAVYKDGVVVGAGFTITNPLVNGRRYTLVDFTSTQGTSKITVDVRGYERVGDGSGALIEDPAEQLKHLLVNFVFNDYKAGAWFADSTAPISAPHFAMTSSFLNAFGHRGSRWYGGTQKQGEEILNEWCNSHSVRAYWTNGGLIAVRPEDHRAGASYINEPWIRSSEHARDYSLTFDSENLVDRISVDYVFDTSSNAFTQATEVADASLGFEVVEGLNLPWSLSSPTG